MDETGSTHSQHAGRLEAVLFRLFLPRPKAPDTPFTPIVPGSPEDTGGGARLVSRSFPVAEELATPFACEPAVRAGSSCEAPPLGIRDAGFLQLQRHVPRLVLHLEVVHLPVHSPKRAFIEVGRQVDGRSDSLITGSAASEGRCIRRPIASPL